MNCLDAITALYATDVRFGDQLVAPMRFCDDTWRNMYRPPLFVGVPWKVVAFRIVAFVPLIIMTVASAFLCVIGCALKMCSSFPTNLEKFKHFSILDDAPTQLFLPDCSKREISSESAQLFSSFEKDCINYTLTFLSFREKRKLLQVSHHFKKVVEDSPAWKLYYEGIEVQMRVQLQQSQLVSFENNLDNLLWVFTPAFEAFYIPLAKCEGFSVIKELPKATIAIQLIKFNLFNQEPFEQKLRNELNGLIDDQFSDKYCFRVILTSPDGSLGEGIVFHDEEKFHCFVCYGDPNEGPIYTRYFQGRDFEEIHYKEKYLIRHFEEYVG